METSGELYAILLLRPCILTSVSSEFQKRNKLKYLSFSRTIRAYAIRIKAFNYVNRLCVFASAKEF